jgi:hypothetical protein
LKDDAGLRTFHALSGDHGYNAIRVVFFDANHVELAAESIASFLRETIRSEFDLIPSQPLEKYDPDRLIKHPHD